MAINPNIPFGGSTGGGGNSFQQSSPFAMLDDLMQLKESQQRQEESQQRIRANAQILRDKQREADDMDAIQSSIRKFTTPDSPEPDWNLVIYDLNGSGHGNAAVKLTTSILEQSNKRADEEDQRLKNTNAVLEMAMKIGNGITDDASFARGKDLMTKFAPKYAELLGDRYDPATIEQLRLQGQDATTYISGQRLAFEKGKDALERTRQAVKDGEEWAKTGTELYAKWSDAASAQLSLSKNAEDWEAGRQTILKGMAILPIALRDAVMDRFDVDYSKGAVERARQIGMTQAQKSNEQIDWARISDARSANEAVVDLTPEAMEILANQFALTGNLPPMGLGGKATEMRAKIYNRAGEIYKGLNLAEQVGAYKANQASLVKLQGMYDALKSFENTALANLKIFLGDAKKVVDTGSPMINRPLRAFSDQVLGSPNMAAYKVARQVIIPEFARILTQPNLTGQLTDDARKEVDEVMKSNYTYAQVFRVAQRLVTDVENRTNSMAQQIQVVKGRIVQPPAGVLSGGNPAQPTTQTGLPPNYNGPVTQDGVVYDITTDAMGNILTQKKRGG